MSQAAGSATISGSAAAPARTMGLTGAFFHNGPVPAAGPGAMAGRFNVQENAGQTSAYRAQGVFVGKR
jgi:hypothetical protein